MELPIDFLSLGRGYVTGYYATLDPNSDSDNCCSHTDSVVVAG